MPRAKTAKQMGLKQAWKVRIVLRGAFVHVVSETEPVIHWQADGSIDRVDWTPIACPHGDTPGYIRWSEVTAITWREA